MTSILDLQRTIGNQGLQRMLEASREISADAETPAFMKPRLAAISPTRGLPSWPAVSMRAFRVGAHVVFGRDQYAQGAGAGRHLLAHELTHVVQQENAAPVVQRQPQAVDIDDLLKEAGETAETAESLKKQLAEGIEDLAIVKWRLALHGQKLPGVESRIDENTTPFFVEGLIETSPFLEPHLRGKLAKTSIGGDKSKFKIYGSLEELETKRDELDRRTTPVTKAAPRKRSYGFYHRRTDSIHLPQDAQFGHALHEGVHKYSSKAMEDIFGVFLNEGVTQHFADRVEQDHRLPGKTRHAYGEQLKCAKKVLRWINNDEAMLAQAYFRGNTNPVFQEVMRRLNIRSAEFSRLKNDSEGEGLCDRIMAAGD